MLYPINMKIENSKCLVVGGGKIGYRKVKSLLKSNAYVIVIAKDFCDEFNGLKTDKLKLIKELFNINKIEFNKYKLIIAATNDSKLNEEIFKEAEKNNIPVNIVDIPELCSFYVPSIIKRGNLMITISTEGKCPALSKYIRKKLENIFSEGCEEELEKIFNYRKKIVKLDLTDSEKKNLINEKIEKEVKFIK